MVLWIVFQRSAYILYYKKNPAPHGAQLAGATELLASSTKRKRCEHDATDQKGIIMENCLRQSSMKRKIHLEKRAPSISAIVLCTQICGTVSQPGTHPTPVIAVPDSSEVQKRKKLCRKAKQRPDQMVLWIALQLLWILWCSLIRIIHCSPYRYTKKCKNLQYLGVFFTWI